MRLLLVRHGVTTSNAEGRYTGQLNVELSALGVRQAGALADRLAAERLDRIVSSPLLRAKTTADLVASRHSLPVEMDENLREISMGVWEGHTFAEVSAEYADIVARWQTDPAHVAPPSGETLQELRDRLVRSLERWQANAPDGTVLWVTHGGVIGVLLCHLLGMDLNRRGQFRRDNTGITELELGHGLPMLARLNDTAHLHELARHTQAEPSQVF